MSFTVQKFKTKQFKICIQNIVTHVQISTLYHKENTLNVMCGEFECYAT